MTEFIFDRIDAVEDAWSSPAPATTILMDIYSYLELKTALGYSEDDEDIKMYHGYRIIVVPDEENLIQLR